MDFNARLARSRTTYHRAQYLRIQAGHLQSVGEVALTGVALGLLDRMIAEYPEESELSTAHCQRAACLQALGRSDEALAAYQQSLAVRRRHPKFGNEAYLKYGTLVLALRRADLYDDALGALVEFEGYAVFPVDRFRIASTRALIAEERDDRTAACHWARRALEEAGATEAPFRYHKKVGLVGLADSDLVARLRRLATSPTDVPS